MYEEAFYWLGRTWDVSAELFQKLQEITSRMYIPSTDATSVNDLRYQLFFVFNEERWIPVNFHLVKTACLSCPSC